MGARLYSLAGAGQAFVDVNVATQTWKQTKTKHRFVNITLSLIDPTRIRVGVPERIFCAYFSITIETRRAVASKASCNILTYAVNARRR